MRFISRQSAKLGPRSYAALSLLTLVIAWAWAARYYPRTILPDPLETLDALAWLVRQSSFYHHLWLTVVRTWIGFGVSMLLGVFGGLLIGRYRAAYWFANPLLTIATTTPPVFWVAMMIIWMGLGSGPPVLVIILTTTPLVMVNVVQGVHAIPRAWVELAHLFGVSRYARLWRLYLPAMRGYLSAAAVIAARFSWRVVIMAEFIGSSSGLGNRLAWARQNLETDIAFAYMLVIVVLSVVAEYVVLRPTQARLAIPNTHTPLDWHG